MFFRETKLSLPDKKLLSLQILCADARCMNSFNKFFSVKILLKLCVYKIKSQTFGQDICISFQFKFCCIQISKITLFKLKFFKKNLELKCLVMEIGMFPTIPTEFVPPICDALLTTFMNTLYNGSKT